MFLVLGILKIITSANYNGVMYCKINSILSMHSYMNDIISTQWLFLCTFIFQYSEIIIIFLSFIYFITYISYFSHKVQNLF